MKYLVKTIIFHFLTWYFTREISWSIVFFNIWSDAVRQNPFRCFDLSEFFMVCVRLSFVYFSFLHFRDISGGDFSPWQHM